MGGSQSKSDNEATAEDNNDNNNNSTAKNETVILTPSFISSYKAGGNASPAPPTGKPTPPRTTSKGVPFDQTVSHPSKGVPPPGDYDASRGRVPEFNFPQRQYADEVDYYDETERAAPTPSDYEVDELLLEQEKEALRLDVEEQVLNHFLSEQMKAAKSEGNKLREEMAK